MAQSNLPTIQRMKWEDYADSATWQDAMQKLLANLNLFITPTYNILNGQVTYQNLAVPQIYQKNITASTTTTFTFMNPLNQQPQVVILGNVWTGLPSTHPVAAVQAMWHYSGNNIVIDNVIGLSSGTNYNLTLLVA